MKDAEITLRTKMKPSETSEGNRKTKLALLKNKLGILKKRTRRLLRILDRDFITHEYQYPIIRFGDPNYQYFFGYYDLSPFNYDESQVLSLKAPARNILAFPGTPALTGYFKIEDPGTFCPVGDTTTWCWQQGCRLQWYPLENQDVSNKIVYNKLVQGRYGCVVQDIQTKKIEAELNRPLYSLSPDGKDGLSLNFSRLQRLRPGYGYSYLPDDTEGQLSPHDDGIWIVNVKTGKSKLLFSVADVASFEPQPTMQRAEHYFNHIAINPNGKRFLFFHIWSAGGKRYTRLITSNMDGSDRYLLIDKGRVSHYTWKNRNEILVVISSQDGELEYHLYEDKTPNRIVIGKGILNADGHPSYSPAGDLILTDSYPDKYNDRHLLLYNLSNNDLTVLGRFFSPYEYMGELRCDLHPRWSPSGKYILFDSAHEGKRQLYALMLQ